MKNMKKLAGILLAMVMVLAMTVPALAASGNGTDNDGKITVNNTVKDAEYSIYRIFDLESFSDDTPDQHDDGAYSYKVNSAWEGFFTAPAEGAEPTNGRKYVNIDDNGYVTWKDGASAAEFAKDALAYAAAEATKINALVTKSAGADNEAVVFETLPLGYYLVDSSVGTLCALTTTNPEATVIEKNANPSLDKDVKEGDAWGDKNDAGIGDTVEFMAAITVQGIAKDYVMHDRMDDGLTFGSVTKVTLNGADAAETTDYTVQQDASHTNGTTTVTDTFDVIFTESFCEKLKSGDKIAVYYTATLNSSAVVNEPENNSAHLEYKDNNGETHKTEPSKTKTYTWGIPVLKYANGDTSKPLANAKFTLYKTETTDGNGSKTYSDPVMFAETTVNNTYKVDVGSTETVITTDETGRFKLDGLDAGTYYLKEIEAPVGYNKLNTVVTVTINHDGQINAVDKDSNGTIDVGEYETEIGVNNQTGSELPSTGGIGTTIFYIVGGILLIGAGVLLVVKKRMSTAKESE